MLTDDGSIKTAQTEVAPALCIYRKKLELISIAMLIIGTIGVLVYVALSVVLSGENEDAPRWVNVFLVFAVPQALGLIGTITIERLKKREKAEGCTGECQFFADCFFYTFKTVLQTTVTVYKVGYPDAVLKGENENYGYIYIFSRGVFAVFAKDGLSEAELNAIRKCLRHNTEGEVAELKNYKSNEE